MEGEEEVSFLVLFIGVHPLTAAGEGVGIFIDSPGVEVTFEGKDGVWVRGSGLPEHEVMLGDDEGLFIQEVGMGGHGVGS